MIANAVNPALKALMVLQQDAQPLNPQGQPTVAAEIAAQAEQKMFAQPGLDQAAQQVGIAAPIQAQQQQQAQTDQITNAVMQKLQGVSSLQAPNMQFKEGGIIGYDGTGDSYVMSPEESGVRPQEGSGLFQAIADYLRGKGTVYEYDPSTDPSVKQTPAATKPPMPPSYDAAGPGERLPPPPTTVRQPAPSAGGTKKPAKPEGGIAAITSAADKDLEALRALIKPQFSQAEPTLKEKFDDYQKSRGMMGLSQDIGVATQDAIGRSQKRMEDMRAEYEEGKKNRGLETFIEAASAAKYGGLGGLGKAYTKIQKEQRTADMNFRRLMDESERQKDQMLMAVEAMKEAAASNNVKDFNAAKKDWINNKQQFEDTKSRMAIQVANISTQREHHKETLAAQEKLRGATAANTEAIRLQTLLANINTEIGRKTEEEKRKLLEKSSTSMYRQLPANQRTPEMNKAIQDEDAQIDQAASRMTSNLENQRQIIMRKLGMSDFSGWGEVTKTPGPTK